MNITPTGLFDLVKYLTCVKQYPLLFAKQSKEVEPVHEEKESDLCNNDDEELKAIIQDENFHKNKAEVMEFFSMMDDIMERTFPKNTTTPIEDKKLCKEEDHISSSPLPTITSISSEGEEEEECDKEKGKSRLVPIKKRKHSDAIVLKEKTTPKRQKTEKYCIFMNLTSSVQPNLHFFTNDIYHVSKDGLKPGEMVNLLDQYIVNHENMVEWRVKSVIISRSSRRCKEKVDSSWYEKECNLIKYHV